MTASIADRDANVACDRLQPRASPGQVACPIRCLDAIRIEETTCEPMQNSRLRASGGEPSAPKTVTMRGSMASLTQLGCAVVVVSGGRPPQPPEAALSFAARQADHETSGALPPCELGADVLVGELRSFAQRHRPYAMPTSGAHDRAAACGAQPRPVRTETRSDFRRALSVAYRRTGKRQALERMARGEGAKQQALHVTAHCGQVFFLWYSVHRLSLCQPRSL